MTEPPLNPLAGFRIGVTAARKVEEQVTLLERRGAEVEWAPALSLDPNQVDDAELRAATDEVLSRPIDMFLATTGIGMKAWFAAADAWGHRRRAGGGDRPGARSWPADPRASAPCVAAGCASCGRRSRSASRTCCEHLRGRDAGRRADRRAGARAVAVDGRARAAPAAART